MKEKISLKRRKSIGVNLDRLKPNTLYPGPSEDYEPEDVVQDPIPEIDLDVIELENIKAKRQAEEEAKRQAEEEAKRQAEEEAKRQAEEEAKRQSEEEAKRQAEEEAKRQAEEEAKRQAEEEAKRQAEEEALALERARIEELKREQVNAMEVKEIVSDETAQILIEQEEETEKIYGNKKAIINLDVISQNFEAGDTVTVNILKEKRLIDKNVYFVKVLARGIIDKPLTVKAQDFSLDAAKMIEITGGRVIILTKRKYF